MKRLATMFVISIFAAGCSGKAPPPQSGPTATAKSGKSDSSEVVSKASSGSISPRPIPSTVFENGLGPDDRELFYHLGEGSELFPLDWLHALVNNETGRPFLETADRYGLLSDPKNADGLPVGLTAAESRDLRFVGKMVGINCAACHVGEITYNGLTMRIDGAPNLFDARTFFAELANSAFATLTDPVQLIAFVSRLSENRDEPEGVAAPAFGWEIRSLIRHVVAEESEIKRPIVDAVKSLLDKESGRDPIKLVVGLSGGNQTASEVRAKLLEGFELPGLDNLLDEAKRNVVAQIVKHAEAGNVLAGTLRELYVTMRLLRARAEFLKRLARLGESTIVDGGFGRVDAFGTARYWLFDPNYQPNAPVSYPHLWGFTQVVWLHYDANTTSVIERNVGQALGLGAVYDAETFASTVLPKNLRKLEQLASKIYPPYWDPAMFGPVDRQKFDNGKKIFDSKCLNCHPRVPYGEKAPELNIDLDEVRTETLRAKNFAEDLPNGQPYYKALADALAKITDRAYADIGVTSEQRKEIEQDRPPQFRAIKKYAGRPLVAIWASAPYLHNGSVPTLWDLLQPADMRPTQFPVGHREYDAKRLGYLTEVSGTPKMIFDATKPGNRNIGHEGPEFGTDLSDDEKWELIEYLKGPIAPSLGPSRATGR